MSDKNTGWVKLWRDQFNHEISERKPWCDGYAWSYLYSRANFRPTTVNFRNQYIPVERGQFVTSKLKLQKIFGWSKKRTNSFLTSLEVGGMSVIRTTNRFIVITICNYDKFQSMEDEKGTTEEPTEGPTESLQRATDKNEQNVKKKRRSPEEIFSKISLLVKRYSDQEIINQAFQAIASTRTKTKRISESVKLSILQSWEKHPVESVMSGIRTYLDKGYHDQGKGEAYLLGIIRNNGQYQEDENTGEKVMKSTGSPLYDAYLRGEIKVKPEAITP